MLIVQQQILFARSTAFANAAAISRGMRSAGGEGIVCAVNHYYVTKGSKAFGTMFKKLQDW